MKERKKSKSNLPGQWIKLKKVLKKNNDMKESPWPFLYYQVLNLNWCFLVDRPTEKCKAGEKLEYIC